MNEIGELIKRKRIEMEMTQQELAAKLGCQSQTVSGWETGRRNVNSAYFSQLSRILKINYQTLLDLSKGEDMDSNKFMDDYMSIETTTDAIHFLDEMLEDFDIDPAVKVSLKFLLCLRSEIIVCWFCCIAFRKRINIRSQIILMTLRCS